MKNMRFGGISPVVLRELSGVYQPFVKAVKEIISNSYDADASKVQLSFLDDFRKLVIRDDGAGMNPIDFVRDYIRIGKSHRKNEFTPLKQRPCIGGKGIGFLAPARYCNVLEVRTKKNGASHGKLIVGGMEKSPSLTIYKSARYTGAMNKRLTQVHTLEKQVSVYSL